MEGEEEEEGQVKVRKGRGSEELEESHGLEGSHGSEGSHWSEGSHVLEGSHGLEGSDGLEVALVSPPRQKARPEATTWLLHWRQCEAAI